MTSKNNLARSLASICCEILEDDIDLIEQIAAEIASSVTSTAPTGSENYRYQLSENLANNLSNGAFRRFMEDAFAKYIDSVSIQNQKKFDS